MAHSYCSCFQYIRKMKRLLDEGKLPDHVDPSSILNAPPSKKPKPGDGPSSPYMDADNELPTQEGTVRTGDATDGRAPSQAHVESDWLPTSEVQVTPGNRNPRSKGPADSKDSDTEPSSIGDFNLSSDDDMSFQNILRSSSPSCEAQVDSS